MKIEDKIRGDDRKRLMKQPEFHRFLFDIIEASAIARTSREEQQSLHMEGKRSLGLEILGWFSDGADPFDAMQIALEARKQFTRSE